MENIISLYEKLGLFYFGKEVDPKTLETTENLLLAFSDLKPEDFEAWIGPDEAQNKGMGPKSYAAEVASNMKK